MRLLSRCCTRPGRWSSQPLRKQPLSTFCIQRKTSKPQPELRKMLMCTSGFVMLRLPSKDALERSFQKMLSTDAFKGSFQKMHSKDAFKRCAQKMLSKDALKRSFQKKLSREAFERCFFKRCHVCSQKVLQVSLPLIFLVACLYRKLSKNCTRTQPSWLLAGLWMNRVQMLHSGAATSESRQLCG